MSYIGITIGPIFDTLMLAEKPSAMWYASSVFSRLTETILCKLENCEIISPAYQAETKKDGIGKYHDRIIVKTDNIESVRAALEEAKSELIQMILDDCDLNDSSHREYLEQYIRTPYVVLTDEQKNKLNTNTVLAISPILDALEQMPQFITASASNPFLKLFNKDKSNENVKKSEMVKGMQSCQLFKDKDRNLKDIKHIANAEHSTEKLKKHSYYAVVSADGDNLGNFFSSIKEDSKIKEFSDNCLKYSQQAADLVGEYGGVTIYAGGDDLLFLAPVQNGNENIFGLCNKIANKYSELIDSTKTTTLSFGVSVRFYKYPLYEALEASRAALEESKDYKNKQSLTFDFQKHSGQAVKMVVPDEKLNFVDDFIKINTQHDSDTVNSIIYIISELSKLFESASNSDTVKNIINNQFDNPQQEKYADYIKKLSENIVEIIMDSDDRQIIVKDIDLEANVKVKCCEALLRISKFLVEKGNEQNDKQEVDDNE